ncbi:MAG: DUF4440 domain-containing protein [Cyclobacteriaceae bacterium]
MKQILLLIFYILTCSSFLLGQDGKPNEKQQKDISSLIDQYSQAREKKDTVLLKRILTSDIDQLVSNGEWRSGITSAVQGMLRSSAGSPGTRTLTIEKIRLLDPKSAVVDCKYEIQNADGTPRKMWSTFIVVSAKAEWKISAIRNMLPAAP